MLTDDTPTYPMTFVAQLDFSGALNEEAITDALEDALARHPLISAVVQSAKRNTECWVRDESVSVEIRWQSFDEDLDLDEFLGGV